MNRLPEPRSLRDLADAIGADVHGPERSVRVLLAPAELADADDATRSAAIVALFDPQAAEEVLASGGVAAVVVPRAAASSWTDGATGDGADAASDGASGAAPDDAARGSVGQAGGPTLLLVEQPRLALAHLTQLFDTRPRPAGRTPPPQ